MNLTGGLLWHWRAWRSDAQWAQTRTEIETWLLGQPIEEEQLILIGASAGWMMSRAWLSRYKSIQTWDIDPLAGPLFKMRHGKALRQHGTALNCFTGDALRMLPTLLKAQPRAAIFFDNVLGQIRFQTHTIHQAENRLQTLTQALCGRHWGSIHDRMSGPVQRTGLTTAAPVAHTWPMLMVNEAQETQKWLAHYYGAHEG